MNKPYTKYYENLKDFEELLAFGEVFSNSLIGTKPNNTNEVYGERIFVKLLCHGMTLVKISPSQHRKNNRELWDISSVYAIARALIETFDAMSYIALSGGSESQNEFRLLFWKLHAEARRLDMLNKIGSSHPQIDKVQDDISALQKQVLNHSCINTCSKQVVVGVENGKYQPYHLTQRERNEESGVNHEYHNAVTMHLSSHVHTHPFSVHQIIEFKAGNEECIGLMGIALQYSSSFLAKAISGMQQLFPACDPKINESTISLIKQWVRIAENGIRNY